MKEISSKPELKEQEIIKDYKFAFMLYKKNFLPFFIILFIGATTYFCLDFVLCDFLFEKLLTNQFLPANTLYGLLCIPRNLVLNGFFGVSIGFGYEIMSSGNQFTEVGNSFYYIKKYWLKYSLLSLILNCFGYIVVFLLNGRISIELELLFRAFSFFWFVAISEAYAAVINRKKFIHALDDNFKILKNNFRRIFLAFSLYYILFLLPRSIIGVLLGHWIHVESNLYPIFDLIRHILTGIYIIIGFPIFAFLSIGVYNSELRFKDRC